MAARKNNNKEAATQDQNQQVATEQQQPVKPIEVTLDPEVEEGNRIAREQIARQFANASSRAAAKQKKNEEPKKENAGETSAPSDGNTGEVPEILTRENWELEGIIPYEEFVKIDFPEIIKNENRGNTTKINIAFDKACDDLKLNWVRMEYALRCANKLKSVTLYEADEAIALWGTDTRAEATIDGFRDIVKWTSYYGIIYKSIGNNESAKDISIKTMLPKYVVENVIELIELEKKFGFTPLDQKIIELNGWEVKKEGDDKNEIKKHITEQVQALVSALTTDVSSDEEKAFMSMLAGDLEKFFSQNVDKYADKAVELAMV